MRYSLSLLLSFSALVMMEGCGGRSSPPASFSYGTLTPLDKAHRRIVIQPGESLAFIALKYGITQEAITSLNNLPEGSALRVGQEIYLPKGSGVVPQRKKIAQLRAKPARTMIEETSLEPLEPFAPGETKKMDGNSPALEDAWEDVKVDAPKGEAPPKMVLQSKASSVEKSANEKESDAQKTKKKEKGDDFFDAYREESLEAELEILKKKEPQTESSLKSETVLAPKSANEVREKTLQVPKNEAPFDASVDLSAKEETPVFEPEVEVAAKQEASSKTKTAASEANTPQKPEEIPSAPSNPTEKTTALRTPAQEGSAQSAPDDSDVSTTSAVDPAQFAWPLPFNGDVTLSFNQMVNGAKNDGINITVPRGTPITAIADGVIAHASPVKGFGNLVLIKHNDVWMSAYGHLDKVQVKQGSKVKKGAKIGTVGQTGYVKTPQLHFELRQSSKPVDPMKVIKP